MISQNAKLENLVEMESLSNEWLKTFVVEGVERMRILDSNKNEIFTVGPSWDLTNIE